MSNRRKLKDLTIRDNFMFTAVMMQDDNCKEFLEMLLGIKIERINISYEKSFLYNPEYKGIRLDVYASDEQNTRYDIEIKDDNCIFKTLKDFLDFVRNDTSTNDTATSSEYVRKLQKTISKVKQNRELEQRFMYIEDYWRIMKKQNEVEVRQKDIIELLEDLGDIPESLSARVMPESDFSRLKIMHKMAAKADSLESFDEAISNL